MDYDHIKETLRLLAEHPASSVSSFRQGDLLAHRDLHGVFGHRFLTYPPLSEPDVALVEKQYSMTLPNDYREFLLRVGNGGAGPGYGLYKLGCFENWDGEVFWSEIPDMVGAINEPFPHSASWNIEHPEGDRDSDSPESEESEDGWSEFEAVYWNVENVKGAIPIGTVGCALGLWLVVSGSERGNIWFDARADRKGIYPILNEHGAHISFAEWYMSWLEKCARVLLG